jgi:hypothetical protein
MTIRRVFFGLALSLSVLAACTLTFGSEPAERADTDLRWSRKAVRIELSNSLLRSPTAIKPDSDVVGALTRSFETWSKVTGIDFSYVWSDRLSVSPAGKFGDGVNLITIAPTAENLLAIGGGSDTTAQTRVFFGRRNEISEADIVLNPTEQFSTDGSFGTFDLQSTLTHEIGHLLGFEHSPVVGATMNALQARSGVFGLNGFTKRSLSDDDLASARAVYSTEAFASISGRIVLATGRPPGDLAIWAEEKETGRVIAGRFAGKSGEFLLEGLERSEYVLFAQSADPEAAPFIAQEIGTLNITQLREYRLERRIPPPASGPGFSANLGFNGQFADLPILLNAGRSFAIYLNVSGGRHDYAIRTSSPFLMSNAITAHIVGSDSTIVEFRITTDEDLPDGEYTLNVAYPDGRRRFFVGALTADRFPNPWVLHDLK